MRGQSLVVGWSAKNCRRRSMSRRRRGGLCATIFDERLFDVGQGNGDDVAAAGVFGRGPQAFGLAVIIDVFGAVDPLDGDAGLAGTVFVEPSVGAVLA